MTAQTLSRPPRLIKKRTFRELLNTSRMTFWRLSKEDPDFPVPVPIRGGENYVEDEAHAYVEKLIARREVP